MAPLPARTHFVQGGVLPRQEPVDPVDEQRRRADPEVEEEAPEVVLDGSGILEVKHGQVLDDHDRRCQG